MAITQLECAPARRPQNAPTAAVFGSSEILGKMIDELESHYVLAVTVCCCLAVDACTVASYAFYLTPSLRSQHQPEKMCSAEAATELGMALSAPLT
eukprot:629007-Rhodomonas_salina.2